jgi:hypothetical protein
MRSQKHSVIAILFSIPFFIEGEFFPAILLLGFAGYSFYRYWSHPERKLLEKINIDSKKFNIRVPSSYPLHLDFLKFYSKYLRLSTQYPALKNTYKELVDSMWLKLSEESSVKGWRSIIKSTDKSWPTPIDVKYLLQKSLNKVSTETRLMNEAMAKAT